MTPPTSAETTAFLEKLRNLASFLQDDALLDLAALLLNGRIKIDAAGGKNLGQFPNFAEFCFQHGSRRMTMPALRRDDRSRCEFEQAGPAIDSSHCGLTLAKVA
jgi:hypothetical protein